MSNRRPAEAVVAGLLAERQKYALPMRREARDWTKFQPLSFLTRDMLKRPCREPELSRLGLDGVAIVVLRCPLGLR